jgi:hypothetical protein
MEKKFFLLKKPELLIKLIYSLSLFSCNLIEDRSGDIYSYLLFG